MKKFNPPLGLPGTRTDGTSSGPNDRAPRVRRAFNYQDCVAINLILSSVINGEYSEIWVEHHEDILAARRDGLLDLYQIKTKDSDDAKWKINDKDLVKAIARFVNQERVNGSRIGKYYFYSNCSVYVPAEHAANESSICDSPFVIKQRVSEGLQLSTEVNRVVDSLASKIQASKEELILVLKKLEFMLGPGITRYSTDANLDLITVDESFKTWPAEQLKALYDGLIGKVLEGNAADVPPLLINSAELTGSGYSQAEIVHRRMDVSEFKEIIYSQLNQAKSRIDKSRKFQNGLIWAVGASFVFVVVLLFYAQNQLDPVSKAINIIKSAGGGSLPRDFGPAVTIVRSAKVSLAGINLSGAHVMCQDMSDLDLKRISSAYVKGSGLIFDRSNLSGADFRFGELNMGKFRYAYLDNAFFDNANLLASNFYGVEARGASFRESTLQGANLSKSDFTAADFSKAKLMLVDFRKSNLTRANLEDVELEDADISGANMSGARGLNQSMLNASCNNKKDLPILDKPLRPSNRPCFTNKHEEDERKVKKISMGFAGVNLATFGYCNKGEVQFRTPDSAIHPENNKVIYLDFADIEDDFRGRH